MASQSYLTYLPINPALCINSPINPTISDQYNQLYLGWQDTEKVNKVENVEKEGEEALSVQPEEEAEKVMTEECAI